jgi:hypothetical protein
MSISIDLVAPLLLMVGFGEYQFGFSGQNSRFGEATRSSDILKSAYGLLAFSAKSM